MWNEVARSFTALLATHAAGRLIRFCYVMVIALLLEPREVGLYLYGLALYLAIIPIANFGQRLFLLTRLRRNASSDERLLAHSLTVTALGVAVTGVGGLTFIWMTEDVKHIAAALSFFIAALAARAGVNWVRDCHVALGDAGWIPRYEAAFRGGEALLGVSALYLGGGLMAICVLHFCAWALEGVLAVRRLHVRLKLPLGFGKDMRLLKAVAKLSVFYMVTLWLLQAFGQLGIVGLRHLHADAGAVGQFGLAMQFVTLAVIPALVFGQAFLPGLRAGVGRGAALPTDITLALKFIVLGSGAVAVLLEAYAVSGLVAVLGDAYRLAGTILTLLAWAVVPYAVAAFAAQALNAVHGPKPAIVVTAAMVSVQVVLMVVLSPIMGSVNATATALVAASVVGCVAGCRYLNRELGALDRAWWLRPAALVGGGLAVVQLMPSVQWLPAVVTAAVGSSPWWGKVLSREEAEIVRALLQR